MDRDNLGFNDDDDDNEVFGYDDDDNDVTESPQWERPQPEIRRGMRELDLAGSTRDALLRTDDPTDPVGIFRNDIVNVSQDLSNSGLEITNDDIVVLLTKVENMKAVSYKNVTAYILGYWVIGSNSQISKRKVDYINDNILFRKVNNVRQEYIALQAGISITDVIRYARLWTQHLLKT